MGRPREFDAAAVLDAALDVFWEKGYEATTTQDLCTRTGLGRGSLYNAFGSKHRLYEEAVRRYAETWAARQLALLAQPGNAWERLRRLMVGVIDADLADPGRRGCLALNAAAEVSGRSGAVPASLRTQFRDLEDALTDVVAAGQRAGELRADRPARQVARVVQSTYYGLRALAKVSDDRAALLDVVEGTLATL